MQRTGDLSSQCPLAKDDTFDFAYVGPEERRASGMKLQGFRLSGISGIAYFMRRKGTSHSGVPKRKACGLRVSIGSAQFRKR